MPFSRLICPNVSFNELARNTQVITFNGQFSPDDLKATLSGLGRDIFFVQIGAMDGVTHDPIHQFVKSLGWRGVLVEPIPHMNKRLKDNYAGCPGLEFAETAITDFEGKIEMAYVDPEAAKEGIFEPGAFGTSTIMQDRGILGGEKLPEYANEIFKQHTKKIEVPCCRLKTLLEKHKVKTLDLLVIDAEGADWMVARQLSLDEYRPRAVYLEYNHLSPYEKIACATHFTNHSYRIYLDKNNAENFLAVR